MSSNDLVSLVTSPSIPASHLTPFYDSQVGLSSDNITCQRLCHRHCIAEILLGENSPRYISLLDCLIVICSLQLGYQDNKLTLGNLTSNFTLGHQSYHETTALTTHKVQSQLDMILSRERGFMETFNTSQGELMAESHQCHPLIRAERLGDEVPRE